MCEMVRSMARLVWGAVVLHSARVRPDTVFEISEDEDKEIRWREVRESSYQQMIGPLLCTIDDLHGWNRCMPVLQLDSSDFTYLSSSLGGKGNCELVRACPSEDYVLQSVGLITYLRNPAQTTHRIAAFYNETQTIRSLYHHPNIISAYQYYVTVKHSGHNQLSLICGTLSSFVTNGSLNDQVTKYMGRSWISV